MFECSGVKACGLTLFFFFQNGRNTLKGETQFLLEVFLSSLLLLINKVLHMCWTVLNKVLICLWKQEKNGPKRQVGKHLELNSLFTKLVFDTGSEDRGTVVK